MFLKFINGVLIPKLYTMKILRVILGVLSVASAMSITVPAMSQNDSG